MDRYRFLNTIPPQTVVGPAVSAAIGCSDIMIQATADCFICVSDNGLGTDGGAVAATNAHFLKGGTSIALNELNASHKVGVNVGTIYISALG